MTKRAAILIGVHNVEKLPKLQAVIDGVKRMEQWALLQGMERGLVRTITDTTNHRVTGQDIEDAVTDVLKEDALEQIIVYFAGHGVNIGYQEYWLLTHALERANHSVNVAGSIERAKYCGVRHIVFLSDCCRTAPKTIQEQGTTGTVIFPNPPSGSKRSHVDVFYATRIGEPSLEIKNTELAADHFRAVYTDAVLDALTGLHEDICEVDQRLGTRVVRPWPFSKKLLEDVPTRVFNLTNSLLRTQVPDSIITSDPTESWLSDLSKTARPRGMTFAGSDESSRAASVTVGRIDATKEIVKAAIRNNYLKVIDDSFVANSEANLEESSIASVLEFTGATAYLTEAFGLDEFDTHCGFRVHGAKIVKVVCHANCSIQHDGRAVEVTAKDTPVSILLVFESGYGALIAALPGFIGSLILEGSSFNDLAYEPSKNTQRWKVFEKRKEEIRQLRAVVAASSKQGLFRLSGDDATELSRRMQLAKSIDPSLALYAAHAYANQGNDKWLQQMVRYLRSDLKKVPLDIALLAGRLRSESTDNIHWTVPFLPMLSQTWAILPAYEVKLPEELLTIPRHMAASSLWSLYAPEGVRLIETTIMSSDFK